MDLLMQGIVLMVIGMATVFAFLVVLIAAMNGSAAFFRKFAHLFPEQQESLEQKSPNTGVITEVAIALAAIKAKRG